MSMHSFDPAIAAQVGVVPAVIYQNILYWAKRNASEGERHEDDQRPRHFHEGRWWTFNSVKGLSRLFPYLTEEQIRRALEKLEAAGFVAVGYFHRDRFNRSKWYSPLLPSDVAQLANASGENAKSFGNGAKCTSGENAECTLGKITESYADIDSDITTDDSLSAEPTPAPQAQSKDGEITLAVKAYNETAERCGLPHVRKLTAARLSKLRARLKDCGGLDGWRDALAKLEASTHCTGGNDRGWRACLDFLLQESSFVKLIEGAYDDKRPKYTNGGGTSAARPMMPGEW